MSRVMLTREDLYAKVWAGPAMRVAREYQISDVALGKICRRMNVPKPPRGYWERLRSGQFVEPSPLPAATDDTQLVAWLHVSKTQPVNNEIQEQISREGLPENRVTVADNVDALHPILTSTREFLETTVPGQNGLITPPTGEGYLSIIASPDQSRRALLIMDALIRALEARGYSTVVSSDYWGEATRVKKEGAEIAISVYETAPRFKRELTPEERKKPPYLLNIPDEHRPAGKLNIKVNTRFGSYDRFTDRQHEALEERLNVVIATLITRLESLAMERRQREEQEQQRQEELRRREDERKARQKLDEDTLAWQRSKQVNEYINAYEARLLKNPELIDADGTMAEWLRWARAYAESIDPLEKLFADKINDNEPQT